MSTTGIAPPSGGGGHGGPAAPDASRRSWIAAAVVFGIGYAVVGIAFPAPAAHAQAWRLAAWVVCVVGFAVHVAYERFWLKSRPRVAASHAALAVALGAFGLAAAANIHSLSVESTARQHLFLLVSLAIWPIITAVPAFLVGLAASALLVRIQGDR